LVETNGSGISIRISYSPMKRKHHLVSIDCWSQRIPFWACVALKNSHRRLAKRHSAMDTTVLDLQWKRPPLRCPFKQFQTCSNLGMAQKKVPSPELSVARWVSTQFCYISGANH
jgi:hypothetical protein